MVRGYHHRESETTMSDLDTYCSVNVKATVNVLILKILDTGLSDAAALLLQIYILSSTIRNEWQSLSSVQIVLHSFSITRATVFC